MNGGQYAKRGVFQTVVGLSAYLNYIVYAIGGAAAAAALGVDISPLLAVGGVSGLAIGLGAKELAAAILGCIQLVSRSAKTAMSRGVDCPQTASAAARGNRSAACGHVSVHRRLTWGNWRWPFSLSLCATRS